MRFSSTFLPLVLGTSFTTLSLAQLNSTGLSSSCQLASTSLVSDAGFNQCINLLGLLNVITAQGSIVTPFNSWLQGACVNTCTPSTLANVTGTIQKGCAADLAASNPLAEGLIELTANYTNIREVLCLAAVSNGTYCLTNLLSAVQTSTGTSLTVNTATSLFGNTAGGVETLFGKLPPAAVCTDCNKELISSLVKFTLASGTTTSTSTNMTAALAMYSELTSECGTSFVDGTIPTDVAVASTAPSSTGASSTAGASASASTKSGAGVESFTRGSGAEAVGLMVAAGLLAVGLNAN